MKRCKINICRFAALVVSVGLTLNLMAAEKIFPHSGSVRESAYSPNGSYFLMAGVDAILFDAKTREPMKHMNPNLNQATCAVFSPDSSLLAVEYWDFDPPASASDLAHLIVVYSIPDGKELIRIKGLDVGYNWRRRLAFSPDGKLLATGNHTMIRVHSVADGKATWEWEQDKEVNPTRSYSAFDVTPDWKYFLHNLQRVSYPDKIVDAPALWNEEKPFFWGQVISPDGSRAFAFGGMNGTEQKLFDLNTGKVIKTLTAEATRAVAVGESFETFYMTGHSWAPDIDAHKKWEKNYWFSQAHTLAIDPQAKELSINNSFVHIADIVAGTGAKTEWGGGMLVEESSAAFDAKGNLQMGPKYQPMLLDLKTLKWSKGTYERPSGFQRPEGFDYGVKVFSADKTFGISEKGFICYPEDQKDQSCKFVPDDLPEYDKGSVMFLDEEQVIYRGRKDLIVYTLATQIAKRLAVPARRSKHGNIDLRLSINKRFLGTRDGDWATYEKRLICVHDLSTLTTVLEKVIAPEGDVLFTNDDKTCILYYGRKVDLYDTSTWELRGSVQLTAGRITNMTQSPAGALVCANTSAGLHAVIDTQAMAIKYSVCRRNGKYVLIDAKGKVLSQ